MIFRVMGGSLILFATILTGYSFLTREKYRLDELSKLETSFFLMKQQIKYLALPLADSFEQISWRQEGVIGDIFYCCHKRLADRSEGDISDIWSGVWQERAKDTYLSGVDLEEIIMLGKTLSLIERGQEENGFDIILSYIKQALEKSRKRLEKNGKLYYSMGVMGGLFIILVML